jgi:hypothetical protein
MALSGVEVEQIKGRSCLVRSLGWSDRSLIKGRSRLDKRRAVICSECRVSAAANPGAAQAV